MLTILFRCSGSKKAKKQKLTAVFGNSIAFKHDYNEKLVDFHCSFLNHIPGEPTVALQLLINFL
jgi:hypothetical protein